MDLETLLKKLNIPDPEETKEVVDEAAEDGFNLPSLDEAKASKVGMDKLRS